MFFRLVTQNPSKMRGGVDLDKVKNMQFLNSYLCMVKTLKRTKVDFLCLLHHHLTNENFNIEQDGLLWIPKTFDELAQELGLSDRAINRIVTSLRQKNIIFTKQLASHKTIRTNYYSINYPNLWELIPESQELFTSLHTGEEA